MYIAQSRCDHRKICYLFDLILCLIAEPYLSPPSGSRLIRIMEVGRSELSHIAGIIRWLPLQMAIQSGMEGMH